MKLSIITINYNDAAGLKKTMESVYAQSCRDFEYIVVDGASKDDSVNVIRQYEALNLQSETCNLQWVSEPDTGIYNAMNKGIRMCNGEYTLMLNSGDYLVDEHVVEHILPLLDGTDIVQGNTIEDHPDGQWRNRGYGRSELTFLDVQRGHFLHQAAFCRRSLFEQYGFFDETYRYVSDTKFFVKCLGYGDASFKYVDLDIANFDMTGFSCTSDEKIRQKHAAEEERLQKELFSGCLISYCLDSERKVELYNRLHRHPLAWKITMLISKLVQLKEGKTSITVCEKL